MGVEHTGKCAKAMRDRKSRLSDPYQLLGARGVEDQAIGVPFLLVLFFGHAKKRSAPLSLPIKLLP